MSLVQQGDTLLFLTADGAEISVIDGVTEMTQMMESAALLCLMGGNRDDDATSAGKKYEWMGNEDEDEENQFRSRFQNKLQGRAITSQLLKDLGEAAALDILNGFAGLIESVKSNVTIDEHRKLTVTSQIEMIGGKIVIVENEIQQQ